MPKEGASNPTFESRTCYVGHNSVIPRRIALPQKLRLAYLLDMILPPLVSIRSQMTHFIFSHLSINRGVKGMKAQATGGPDV
jgi:hypothetical protein